MQQIQTWEIGQWGQAVSGSRQVLGSLVLPFNGGCDPKLILKPFRGEKEKSPFFSVGGDKPPLAHA